jgi:hypothetical protein
MLLHLPLHSSSVPLVTEGKRVSSEIFLGTMSHGRKTLVGQWFFPWGKRSAWEKDVTLPTSSLGINSNSSQTLTVNGREHEASPTKTLGTWEQWQDLPC